MNCKDFNFPLCYDCRWFDPKNCEINRLGKFYVSYSFEHLKDETLYFFENKNYHPTGTLIRHEKALELYAPKVFEWWQKMKLLI
jgi:hypothetical protein